MFLPIEHGNIYKQSARFSGLVNANVMQGSNFPAKRFSKDVQWTMHGKCAMMLNIVVYQV